MATTTVTGQKLSTGIPLHMRYKAYEVVAAGVDPQIVHTPGNTLIFNVKNDLGRKARYIRIENISGTIPILIGFNTHVDPTNTMGAIYIAVSTTFTLDVDPCYIDTLMVLPLSGAAAMELNILLF